MSAIASPEFVSLCQAQLQLLTQQISGTSAAVYIAEMAGKITDTARGQRQLSEPNFVPVISYPEPMEHWVEDFARTTAQTSGAGPLALLPGGEAPEAEVEEQTAPPSDWPQTLPSDRQLVVPLVYADVVVGLMVAVRRDRDWEREEQHYVENMAQSLAAGCVMERRTQWLQSQIAGRRDFQSRQSEIFHNLLHQFRNPLTAVNTFGQLLVRRLEPEDPNQKIATGIVRESKRLREMVAHFDETVAIGDADLAREPVEVLSLPASPRKLLPVGEAESTKVTSSPVVNEVSDTSSDEARDAEAPDANVTVESSAVVTGLGHSLSLCPQYLPDIVEPVLAVASIVAMEKGITIQSQVAVDTPLVWGDEEALGEVVSNLVDNAVKYSPSGAHVWVQTGVSHISQAHHYQGIVVGDTGPGIPPEDLAHLFERNYRGVQAHSNIPGTGLGLAIAQALMNQMEGSIEAISPAVGTPWIPPELLIPSTPLKGRSDVSITGPGTVFIVWLKEAASA